MTLQELGRTGARAAANFMLCTTLVLAWNIPRYSSVVPHVSSLTASLAIIVPTRSPFFEISKSQKSEHVLGSGLSRPH